MLFFNDTKFAQKCNYFKGILYTEMGAPIFMIWQGIKTLKRRGRKKTAFAPVK
jgi:hypothetical protein